MKKQSELEMPTELLYRKLPKQRFKKKITKSLFHISTDIETLLNEMKRI